MTNWKPYLIIILLTAIAIIAVIQNLMDDHKVTDDHSSQAGGGISHISSPKPSPATLKRIPSLREIQRAIGAKPDGVYGKETRDKWERAYCNQEAAKINWRIHEKEKK